MIFTILLLLKILLFMNITSVEYNKFFVFLTSALFIILIFTTIYLSDRKKKKLIGLVTYILLSLILFIDVLHYTYFNALPSVKMLSQVNQVAAVGDSVKSIFTLKNALMILDIPILIYLVAREKREDRGHGYLIQTLNKERSKKISWGVPALVLALVVSNLVFLNLTDRYESVSFQEPFTFHARDIKTSLSDEDPEVDMAFTEDENPIEDLRDRASLKKGKHTGIAKDKNLIVLQVEALQNFVINREYEGQVITPNLNKLIEDSGTIYFDHYYQLIGRGNTSDAEFVTNNSLYPSMEEPSYTSYQDNTFYGLPLLLKDEGYTPWAFHGYKKDFWNRAKAYKNQGYERFISEEDFHVTEENTIGFGINDEEFYKQSMDYLKELDSKDDKPFYAFMVSLTSHNPFNMPDDLKPLKIKKEHEGTLLGDYINSIHYADREIGNFIDMLKKEGLYDDTVIAIYGDHFAINTSDEKMNKIMTDYLGYDYKVDEMMNIPLIINIPGEEVKETVSRTGSQMDFYPTIMNIMGVDNKKGIVFGRDLLNYKGENLVAPQTYTLKGSFFNDDIALIMSRDGVFENSSAYNLHTREELSPLDYREEYQKVVSEINLADYILKKDLMKEILEGKDDLDLNKKYIKDVKLSNTIKNTNSSMEEIEGAIENGYKAITLDIDFKGGKILVGDGIPMEDIEGLMEKHQDLSIVTRVKTEDNIRRAYQVLKDDFPDIKDRIYPEIEKLDVYQNLSSFGFNVIVNVSKGGFTDEEMLDFADRYNVRLMSMDKKRGKTKLVKKLLDKDVFSYIYNVDSKIDKMLLEKKGARGIFTDKLN